MLEEFKKDLISAMKNKDKVALNTLRSVKAAMQLEVINKRKENDELLVDVVNKQIKMRNDSIKEFEKGGREDLILSYKDEIEVLNKYMPKQLTLEEAVAVIEDTIKEINATSVKEFGLVMKSVTPKLKNRFDMSKVSEIIKSKLG